MIVFVLRHADKRPEPNADDLTELGVKRAKLLGRMLAETASVSPSAARCGARSALLNR